MRRGGSIANTIATARATLGELARPETPATNGRSLGSAGSWQPEAVVRKPRLAPIAGPTDAGWAKKWAIVNNTVLALRGGDDKSTLKHLQQLSHALDSIFDELKSHNDERQWVLSELVNVLPHLHISGQIAACRQIVKLDHNSDVAVIAARTLYQLSTDSRQDAAVFDSVDVLRTLIRCSGNGDVLVHTTGCLKHLSANEKYRNDIALLLQDIVGLIQQPRGHQDTWPVQALQIVTILRNVCDAAKEAVVESMPFLCPLLKQFSHDSELVLVIARTLSKLSLDAKARAYFKMNPEALSWMFQAMKHCSSQNVCQIMMQTY